MVMMITRALMVLWEKGEVIVLSRQNPMSSPHKKHQNDWHVICKERGKKQSRNNFQIRKETKNIFNVEI